MTFASFHGEFDIPTTSTVFRHNPRNMNESLILFGDVGGGVSSLMFSEATTNLFDVNIGNVFVRSNRMYQKKKYCSPIRYNTVEYSQILCMTMEHNKTQCLMMVYSASKTT